MNEPSCVQPLFEVSRINSPAEVFFQPVVTSTNDLAAEAGRQGAAHLTCYTANVQTKGRGRLGRSWFTLPGRSIAASFILRDVPSTVALGACLAVQRAVLQLTGKGVYIKWPNDVRFEEAKLAGVLTESHTAENGARFYILGIGLNVSWPQEPVDAGQNMTTLEDIAGVVIPREEVLEKIIHNLRDVCQTLQAQGFEALQDEYSKNCETLGKLVQWHRPGGQVIEGLAQRITADGTLVLETPQGLVNCMAGDVVAQAATGS